MWDKMDTFLRTKDSARTADWWKRYWRGPWTLADCGYGNCTHQNHQEGKWRPVKRGTGCGANGDERQGLGTFVGNLVGYTRSASEDHEQKLIEAGRPNLFVRNPVPSKKEWDAVQALHPKILLCSVPCGRIARWDLEEYLDVMDTAVLVTRIDTKTEELWGDLYFKCSCKTCFVRGCCRESVIWSMVLNPKLVINPKYAKLEPGERKRKGRPTEKRVAKLKEAQAEVDARPFVDKAAPRVSSTHTLYSI